MFGYANELERGRLPREPETPKIGDPWYRPGDGLPSEQSALPGSGQVRSIYSETSFGLRMVELNKRVRLAIEDLIEELTVVEAKLKIDRDRTEILKRARDD